MSKPTLKEKIEVYEALLMRINFHRTLSMREGPVLAILQMIDEWANAHQGEKNSKEIEANINAAFEKLKHLP